MNEGIRMFTLSMKTPFMAAILVTLIAGCATGNTPEAKKENARKETQEALASIYAEHPLGSMATSARSSRRKSSNFSCGKPTNSSCLRSLSGSMPAVIISPAMI